METVTTKITNLSLSGKKKTQQYKQKKTTATTTTGKKTTTTTKNVSNKAKTSNSEYVSPNKLEFKVSKVFFRTYDLNYDLNFK